MLKRIVLISSIVVLITALFVSVSTSAPSSTRKLIVAVSNEPTSMDPSLAIATQDFAIVENYGEYLISRTPSGDLEPGLAASWKLAANGTKIEFTLRKGVKFHSGDPFTVKDVLFSYERAQKNPITGSRVRNTIKDIEVTDDYHFTINFKGPDVNFIPMRGGVMISSKNYFDRVGEETFVRQPIGTGPYKFVHYAPGEYIDMMRYEEYWGKHPSIKEARFYFVGEETTRMSKLKTGEVDLVTNCPDGLVKEFKNSSQFNLIRLDTNFPNMSVAIANRNPNMPWYHRTVRQAMAYAIDWKSITQYILYGVPNHLMYLAPYEVGYDPTIKPYTYDPKKAKELLSQAGYPNGFELSLYYYFGRTGGTKEIAEAVASYFQAVGIRTKLVGEEFAAARERSRAAKAPNAVYVGILNSGLSGMVDPSYALQQLMVSDGPNSVYSNPDLDRVAADARKTIDVKKRAELIKRAQRIMYEDVAIIPISNGVTHFVTSKNINFNPTKKYYQDLVLVKDIKFH